MLNIEGFGDGKKKASQLGQLGQIFKQVGGKNQPLLKQIEALALMAAPHAMLWIMSGGAEEAKDTARETVERIKEAGKIDGLSGLVDKVHEVSRAEVRAVVAKFVQGESLADTIKTTAGFRRAYTELPKEDVIATLKAIDSIFPDKTKKILAQIFGNLPAAKQTPEQYVDAQIAKFAAKTNEEIAAEEITQKAKFPVDALADYVYETLQGLTEDKIQTAVKTFADALDADAVADTTGAGILFAQDLLSAAMTKGGRFAQLDDMANAQKFGAGVKSLLTAFETAASGLLPTDSSALTAALKAYSKPPRKKRGGSSPDAPSA